MLRSILVPLDGTSFAESALPVASQLSKNARCPLHLVLSHTSIPVPVGMGGSGPVPLELDQEARDRERSYLQRTAEWLGFNGSSQVECHEVDGPAGPAVCDEAVRIGAELIVMATHARGPAGRLWHGSVADHVVRHTRATVLLVRPEPPISTLARSRLAQGEPRGILVALDLSPNSEAILNPVLQLALLTQAPVTLLHVIAEPSPLPEGPLESLLASRVLAGQHLEVLAEGLRAAGLCVTTRVVAGFNPAWSIRDVALESQFDILALATRGAGGLRRFLRGSVAEQVIEQVSKPILILRQPDNAGGRSASVRRKRRQSN